jgi:hypothetical protein
VRPSVDQLDPPVFSCVVNATTPVPAALPRVTWRAGLDLDPVDISDPNQVARLEALVWPEQSDRLAKNDRDHRNIGAGMDDIAFADILRWGRFPFWAKDASIGPRYCSKAMSEIVTYNLPINS